MLKTHELDNSVLLCLEESMTHIGCYRFTTVLLGIKWLLNLDDMNMYEHKNISK